MRRKKVRLHLKSGRSLEGFLRRWAGHYILDVAEFIEAADSSHPLDGRVKVPRQNVDFYQEL